jgi:Putative DNA-binding domain
MNESQLMTLELFEKLLSNGEGYLIDYKKEQYLFDKADFTAKGITDPKVIENKKGELLKDIMAFANTERNFDAFILIGIEDLNNGNKNLFDAKHIDDAALHQFINEKTNNAIKFEYKPFQYSDKSIGVYHIHKQDNLVCANNDFGAVRRNAIYVRNGSATRDLSVAEIIERLARRESNKLLQPVFEFYAGFSGYANGCVTDVGINIRNLGDLIQNVKFTGINEFEFINQSKQTFANTESWNFSVSVDTSKYPIKLYNFPNEKSLPEGISFKIEYTDKLGNNHSKEFYFKSDDRTLTEISK